jgi:holliday junction DNA helicase RuvA
VIARLRGTVVEKTPDFVVIEAGGVGYHVTVTVGTFYDLPDAGHEAVLHVHTHIWSDGMALYGFSRKDERAMFLRLIGVSGIGPKLARNILSGIRAAELSHALRTGDIKRIFAVPGVGKKLADRMVLELGARETAQPVGEDGAGAAIAHPVMGQVVSALVNLGYKQEIAVKTVAALLEKEPEAADVEALLRRALQALTK